MRIELKEESFAKLKFYLKECQKNKEEYSESFSRWELTGDFLEWRKSLDFKSSPLSKGLPWLTFSATRFLEKAITKEMRVYEYGSGGSTKFFCRKAKEVISVEHDSKWQSQVEEELKSCGHTNFNVSLIESKLSGDFIENRTEDPDSYFSNDSRYIGQSFQDYASDIDKYPDEYFDIVLIDGRARPSCFKHSVSKVKKNGFIILDNADRSYYAYIHKSLDKSSWKKSSFYGPGPYSYIFWETCFWQSL